MARIKNTSGKRIPAPDVASAGQSASGNESSAGNGQVIERAIAVSAIPSRQSKSVSWASLVDAIKGNDAIVTNCWHPQPEGDTVKLDKGDVRALHGEAAYQLSSGEIVKL